MQAIAEVLKAQNLTISSEPSQKTYLTTQTSNELSVYQGTLTKEGIVKATAELLKAFPKMPHQTIGLIKERFKANGFSDERALDAVNHVIDNYQGWDKLPNVANFISYDKKIKLYTHNQVTENNLWQDVEAVDVGIDKPRWAMKEAIKNYGLKLWEK